jgi:hypothetical protein
MSLPECESLNMVHVNTDSPVRLASTLSFALLLLASLGAPAGAQPSAADSLAERLRRAEAAIEALQVQMSEQAAGGVTTRSGARLQLNGRVLVKAFGNARAVNNVDNPQFVEEDAGPLVSNRGIGMTIRETRLGLVVTVPEALGGSFTGDVDVDFYGGQVPSSGGRTFPLIRMRTARGIVRWSQTELLVGQESPLISGLNPVTLGAVGTPTFATAGNLWLWLPQVRFGVAQNMSTNVRWGLQSAVLAPTSGDPSAPHDTDYDVAERSQRPFLQGRLHLSFGEADMMREIGCGIHYGHLELILDQRAISRAFACDVMLPVTDRLELRGEYFTGQGLRGLGGGGIGQNFTPGNEIVPTEGGWAQINAVPLTLLRVGAGCGTDQPDHQLATRRRNDACAAHAVLHPVGPIFFGVEARRIRTTYSSGRYTNDHVTAAFGFEF